MREAFEQLSSYANGIWRFRWYAVAVSWVVVLVGWAIVSNLPDEYEANAKVYVDTGTILRPLLKGLTVESADVGDRLGLMTRKLLSRPNLEKLMRMVDFDIKATSKEEQEALLNRLEGMIELNAISTNRSKRQETPDLYEISARHNNPETAKKIVQSLLTIFVETILGETRQDSSAAQKFLDQQIKEYEARLVEAENRLREFKSEHVGELPEQGGSYFQRLQQTQSALEQAELEMREAQYRRDELNRQLQELKATGRSAVVDGKTVRSPVEERLLALQTKLDELLLRYTREHPAVIETEDAIAALQQQKEAESGATQESSTVASPMYQQLQLALGEADASLAAIRVRKDEYQRRVQRLKQHVETLPKVEAELQRLNRDYEVNRENYTALVSRRESARMAEDVESTGENVKFKVIDPPRVPPIPAGPDRILLSTLVLLAGIGGGIGLALLLSQFRPAIHDQRTLQRVAELPVFGSVSMVQGGEALLKQRLEVGSIIAVAGLLIMAYGGVVSVYLSGNTFGSLLASLQGLV